MDDMGEGVYGDAEPGVVPPRRTRRMRWRAAMCALCVSGALWPAGSLLFGWAQMMDAVLWALAVYYALEVIFFAGVAASGKDT